MIVQVAISKEVLSIDIDEDSSVAELKRRVLEIKKLPNDAPFPYWVLYQGLVLTNDTTLGEVGILPASYIICSETLLSSVVVPTSKGSQVWKVSLKPSSNSSDITGDLVGNSNRSGHSKRTHDIRPYRLTFFGIDLSLLINSAGTLLSFWYLSTTLSHELSSFKEGKSFSDIAKSIVNGSIEGMLENLSTIKKLVSNSLMK